MLIFHFLLISFESSCLPAEENFLCGVLFGVMRLFILIYDVILFPDLILITDGESDMKPP